MASSGAPSPARVAQGFIAELDGLRGIAILLVVVHRFWPRSAVGPWADAAGAGWIGVDLFFVISGFLIAGILLDTRGEPGFFRNFYARRILRIFPLYYLFVGGVFLAFSGSAEFREHSGSPIWYLVHLGNMPEGMLDNDVPYWLAPVWSLAIEEQFYLTFPLVVAIVRPERLGRVLVAMIIAAPLIRLGTMLVAPERERIQYLFTLCRLDTIAVGCLLAVIFRRIDLEKYRDLIVRGAAVIVCTAALFAIDTGLDRTTPVGRTLGYTVVAFACASVVALVVLYRGQHETGVLRFAPLAYLGKLCFGLYLLHRPADTLVSAAAARVGFDHHLWLLPVKLGVAVVLATISWRLLERPFLKLKKLFESKRHPAGGALVVGILVLLAACSSSPRVSADDAHPGDDASLVDGGRDGTLYLDAAEEVPGSAIWYPPDRRHSPITAAIAARLAAIAPGHQARVFAKVGDSITASDDFLKCFDGNPDLGATGLAPALAYYAAGNAAGASPFGRTSLAAVGGTTAAAPLAGSPCTLDRELAAVDPKLAIVMFGTNDVRTGRTVDDFGSDLWSLVDRTLAAGVIPALSSIPPMDGDPGADARIPIFNSVIRAVAQGRGVPFVDYHRDMLALPNRGISGDGLHPSKSPSGACALTASGLAYGYNVRNLVTLEVLARVKAALDGTASDSAGPPRVGTGFANDPVIAALPLADLGDTRVGDAGSTCGSTTGKAIIYSLQLATAKSLEVHVVDHDGVDVDIHLRLGTTCLASGDKAVTAMVGPGTVQIIVDAKSPATDGEFVIVAR
jgi:peptidoglycan/LPS O-acetylase OafA/YrhL